jgi:hypothetical protein
VTHNINKETVIDGATRSNSPTNFAITTDFVQRKGTFAIRIRCVGRDGTCNYRVNTG